MRAVVQRVLNARVEVEGETVGAIGPGLLVYLGAGQNDDDKTPEFMANKLAGLRIFPDEQGKMSRSIGDLGHAVLVVSQFTLYGDVRKGRRPSFDSAAAPEPAERLYQRVCHELSALGLTVATGRFRADMRVFSEGDGPVTILIDSERLF